MDGTRNVVMAAQAAEVPRLVHISTEVRCMAVACWRREQSRWGPVSQALLHGSQILHCWESHRAAPHGTAAKWT